MASPFGLQPAIVVLREGTDTSQGKGQLLTNINACVSLSEVLQTTLGPRGMDKLIVSQGKATVSNDGATIMSLLDVVHPAAKCLVDIARSQDSEIGDGTTSVVVLAGALLKACAPLVEEGMHPRLIIRAYQKCLRLCREAIAAAEKKVTDAGELRPLLERMAATAMNSKLIAPCKEQFSRMVVDAVLSLVDGTRSSEDQLLDMGMIGIKQVLGGALQESQLVRGVAFKKTFSYAGHEQLKKKIENPKIMLLNFELEWQAEKDNAEIRLSDPAKFREIVEAEYRIVYSKLDAIVASGASVVFSNKSIGDLATQYFADHGIFCAGRVADEDLRRLARCSGARIISAVTDINADVLGLRCGLFEEKQVGAERFNFLTEFSGSEDAPAGGRACTFILRGGADQFIAESERSLHDALMVVRRAVKAPAVIAGGGSIEMMLSSQLYKYARTVPGKEQLAIEAFAKALEAIPRNLADNAGLDSTDILNKLRSAHAAATREGRACWEGVDINTDCATLDCMAAFVWEPSLIRQNALASAVEAACVILSVDQTVKLQSDTQNINETRSKTREMKEKLEASGMQNQIMGAGMHRFQGAAGK